MERREKFGMKISAFITLRMILLCWTDALFLEQESRPNVVSLMHVSSSLKDRFPRTESGVSKLKTCCSGGWWGPWYQR